MVSDPSDYVTLAGPVVGPTLVIQKSRFIAQATTVDNVAAAQAWLAATKKQHPAATHHCYAYVVGDGQKSSDDGEPAGTAGMPLLRALQNQGLSNVCVVVTRYFGGIKLGTGGLTRAYGQAAASVLTTAAKVIRRKCTLWQLVVPYAAVQPVVAVVEQYGRVLEKNYTTTVTLTVAIPQTKVALFRKQIAQLSLNVEAQLLENEFVADFVN